MSTSPTEPLVLRHDANGVATLTLNRPRQFNALSRAMLSALQQQLDAIAADDAVRAVVLAGAGRAFCAGHDLKEMQAERDEDVYRALFDQCSQMMLTINQLPQPVIAKVHGIATAAGCQLVAACDLAVAAETASFATSGIRVGLFCSTPAVPVSRSLTPKQALEMLLTGEFVAAEQALAWGFINRVAAADELDAAVDALLATILNKSDVALRTGKAMFYKQLEMGLAEAYRFASETMACNMMAEDTDEGIRAFMEKRPATWQHR